MTSQATPIKLKSTTEVHQRATGNVAYRASSEMNNATITAVRRYVNLPAIPLRVPLGAYVAGIKAAKARPDAVFKHGLSTWGPTTGREIVRQFRQGLHDRINQRGRAA